MYLNVEEVETAIELVATGHPGITERLVLPEKTWEGRTCSAIRVHDDEFPPRTGVYLTGGLHAREWGSTDLLVRLVQRLTDAYRDGTGLTEGGAAFTAAEVRSIVRNVDLVVFPLVNPDGRAYSMTKGHNLWRKNRRPAQPGSPCVETPTGEGDGVDVNRNFDFLWDFEKHLHPDPDDLKVSASPCATTYHGPSAASEPETRNVVWLYDNVGSIGYSIDIHSYGEWILYPFGDDQNQDDTPDESFTNPAWDGKRGLLNDVYGEYLAAGDEARYLGLAAAMADGIKDAHGRSYEIAQSVDLLGGYVTTGTIDDYAHARHVVDHARPKVFGFTVEWGPDTGSNSQSFQPDYPDMVRIMEEVAAGLLEFCLAVSALHGPPLVTKAWTLVAYILFGVTGDGGGLVWLPGKGPVPIDPWGPLRRVDEEVAELVLAAAREIEGELTGDLERDAELLRPRVAELLGEERLETLRGAFRPTRVRWRPEQRSRLRRAARATARRRG